jgi:hypothetical protein
MPPPCPDYHISLFGSILLTIYLVYCIYYLMRQPQHDDETNYELDNGPANSPPFSGRYCKFEWHTHAPIKHLLYHLCPTIVLDSHTCLTLTATNAGLWSSLTQNLVITHSKSGEALKKLRIKIPGKQMARK